MIALGTILTFPALVETPLILQLAHVSKQTPLLQVLHAHAILDFRMCRMSAPPFVLMAWFMGLKFVTITEQEDAFQAVQEPRTTIPVHQVPRPRQVYVNASLATRFRSQDVSPPVMMGRRWAMKSVTMGTCKDA
jgi:hypothetical protein